MIPRECYRWILFRIQADFFGYLVDCYFCTHTGLLFPTNGFPTTGDLPPYAHLVAFYSNGLHLFPSTYKYTLWIALQSTSQKRNNKVTIVLRLFSIYAFFVGCLFLTGMAFIVFPQLQYVVNLHILLVAFYRSGQHMFSCTFSSTVSIYAFCWSRRDLVERRGAIQNMGHTTPHWLANCFFCPIPS